MPGAAAASGAPTQSADTAASSKASWQSCPSGAVCLYTGSNGQGTRHVIYGATDHNYKHISSVWNHGTCGSGTPCWVILGNANGASCVAPGKKQNRGDATVYSVRWTQSC
ncbi:peptidase inhibitor family I36 protein [Streptomyces diacarni]|uniref:peptidase inhibitor family I36 protein n=1 Tax=Streptomyces diacarni TaxID=2800381 RepID=UPI003402F339